MGKRKVSYAFVPYVETIETLADLEEVKFSPYERETGNARFGHFVAFAAGEGLPDGAILVPIREAQKIFGLRWIRSARALAVGENYCHETEGEVSDVDPSTER